MMNNTIKIIGITLLLTSFINLGSAQEDEMRGQIGERIKSEKIGYLTSELDLTSEEAVAFWPIYNEYDAKRQECKSQIRKTLRQNTGSQGTLDHIIALRTKEVEVEKTYLTKLADVISEEKVVDLIIAENNFKRKLLKKVRQKMKRKNKRKQ